MARKKEGKKEAEKSIKEFFSETNEKSEKDVKRIKRLAMAHNIKLGKLRERFCKKCYSVFNAKNCETRIKNKRKIIRCLKCGYINRINITKTRTS